MDPVTRTIYWDKFVSITEEAGAALARTAFSRVVTETRDYSCALFDDRGRLLAQSLQSMPGFIGTLQNCVNHMLRQFPPSSLMSGDTLMTNDPWLCASQLNDFALLSPIRRDGRVIAFAGTVAHSPDVGGRLLSSESTEVYEEGVCFPPCKLWERGTPSPVLFSIIRANVRIPDTVVGDLFAQRSAHTVMEHLLLEFVREERLPSIRAIADELYERAAAAMREAIHGIPIGTYRSEVTLDCVDRPCTIRCVVDVSEERVLVDFSGSSPSNRNSLNCSLGYVAAETQYCIAVICRPETYVNAGSFEPIAVTAPPGTIVSAERPCALGARTSVVQYIPSAIFQALAAAAPTRVRGEVSAPAWVPVIQGETLDGRPFVEHIFLNGGIGGGADGDGFVVGFPSPVVSTKVEAFESEVPFVVEEAQLVQDSAGAGRSRGGPGQSFRVRWEGRRPARVFLRLERMRNPPKGVLEGLPGSPGAARHNGRTLGGKESFWLQPGDVLELESPGGGGYGSPRGRPRPLVEKDLLNEIVSAVEATELYGWQTE